MQTYRKIFLHPTKTGGTSVINVLNLKKNHRPLHNKMGRGFFKFTTVRNPYERVISLYYFLKHYETETMDDFLSQLDQLKFHINYLPQHKYTHINGRQYVDKIFKLENLKTEFKEVFKKDLIHINKSPVQQDKLKLTEDQKEKIYNIYRKDFELLNYKK